MADGYGRLMMLSPAIWSSRSRLVTSLARRKSWSRTIWFHIAVGAATKNGKQITVAAAALAIRTRNATPYRRSSSNQPRTIRRVTTPQTLIVIAESEQRPGDQGLAREATSRCGRGAVAGGWRSAVLLWPGSPGSVDFSE